MNLNEFINPELMINLFHILIKVILAVIIITIIKNVSKFIAHKVIEKRFTRISSKRSDTIIIIFDDLIKYVSSTILILTVIIILGVKPSLLIASVGVISLVLGLAMQTLISDMVSGIFTLIEGYYDVGDYISIKGFEGDVQSLGIRATTLVDPSNKVITIPNSQIIEVTNYSKMDYIAYLEFSFSYETDLDHVKNIINNNVIPIFIKNELIFDIEYLGIKELASSEVIGMCQVTSHARNRHAVRRKFNEIIKLQFDIHNIEIPYKQIVMHQAHR